VAAFGLLSAVLAALVPAWIASRQDVVAVLAGRRADRRTSLRSPAAGIVLLGLGIAGSAYGAHAPTQGEIAIAAAAVVAVVGMILLVPVVVALVARLSGRLPLPARYAARDAARHRTRTVPAVAAVAATVAGVVALGIGVTSDEAENRATYSPSLPNGIAALSDYGRHPRWDELRAAIEQQAPGVHPVALTGVREGHTYVDLRARRGTEALTLDSYGGALGTSLLVSRGAGLSLLPGLPASSRAAAEKVLGRGGAIVFTDRAGGVGQARLRTVIQPTRGRPTRGAATVPILAVHVGPTATGPQAVLSPSAARALAVPTAVVGMTFDAHGLTPTQQENLTEALAAVSPTVSFYVERGYVAPQSTAIVQLVLGGLGAVLMLGGTLTATFLALSDARPDLATLSAVGASPRRRRSIAAAYALVVGFVGSVLGAAVGFIPGIAVTFPLTHPAYSRLGPFLDVPWLLVVGLVVGLPVVTALVVAGCTRSRLPLVARLD
jgi:putative ABC transport system permease protein